MKKQMILLAVVTLFGATHTLSAQCSSSKNKHHVQQTSYSYGGHKSIVEQAVSNADFSTLVAALKAADLVDALSGDGPFTVFAPDNAAFNRLEDGTVASLLEPRAKGDLTDILTYHVVSGRLESPDVVNALSATGSVTLTALNGKTFEVIRRGDNIYIKDGKGQTSLITSYDIKGTNGVIHVIDTVILP